MTFESVLFFQAARAAAEPADDPPFFSDLNLDQVADTLLKGRDSYNLRPFFRIPLRSVDEVAYRHEVLHDLETLQVLAEITAFADAMRSIRETIAATAKLYYKYERERWFFDAANRYREAVGRLLRAFSDSLLASRALNAFRDYLARYVESAGFRALRDDIAGLGEKFAAITYAVVIEGDRLNVREPQQEDDLVAAIHDTFARFRQGAVKSYLLTLHDRVGMNHIEAKVLDFVALLHPQTFVELDRFAETHAAFIDRVIERFDREIQFYLACFEYARRFESAGLPMCFPRVSSSKAVSAEDTFDVALAQRLSDADGTVVRNDFALADPERIFIISGPNQGGKTTFARTFGQLQYLAALGCRVAGRSVATFLFDAIFTHFERQEDPSALHGKLEDDILRIHEILERATTDSIIILNEIFSATTVRDATVLARRTMGRILALDALCVCVTFIDELSTLSEKTVSMVSLVDAENPDIRTYKLARRPADGLAYALSLAEKYSLTYDRLTRRLDDGQRP
jgi:DNA mismatch repair protein MutS